jgi:pimeloyl-ACP methyl ester carboxylesterase
VVRAREPDLDGYVARDDVRVGYEVFGDGEPTLLLVPAWTIVQSRVWKLQVPYLARHFRVVTFDRPGNGRSDRPSDPVAHHVDAVIEHILSVLDATATDRAVLVSLSQGAREALKLAAEHADRVLGAIFIAPACLIEPGHPERIAATLRFFEPYPLEPESWERLNAQYWLDHFEDFAEFFFSQCFPEPHSTKQHEDCVGWAGETTSEVLLASVGSELDAETIMGWAEKVSVPTLVIHGDDDRVSPLARGEAVARSTHGDLVVLEGAGHIPLARDPVRVNLLIRDFVDRLSLRSTDR